MDRILFLGGILLLIGAFLWGILWWVSPVHQQELEAEFAERQARRIASLSSGGVDVPVELTKPLVRYGMGSGRKSASVGASVSAPAVPASAPSPAVAPASTPSPSAELVAALAREADALLRLQELEEAAGASLPASGNSDPVPARGYTSSLRRRGCYGRGWVACEKSRVLPTDRLVYVDQKPRYFKTSDLVRVKSEGWWLMVSVGGNKPSVPYDDEPPVIVRFSDGRQGEMFLIPPNSVAWIVPPASGGWDTYTLMGFRGSLERGLYPACFSKRAGLALADSRGDTWRLSPAGCTSLESRKSYESRVERLIGAW